MQSTISLCNFILLDRDDNTQRNTQVAFVEINFRSEFSCYKFGVRFRRTLYLHLPVRLAVQKLRLVGDGWNSREPKNVAFAYIPESRWRNRPEFINGRQDIIAFLTRKA